MEVIFTPLESSIIIESGGDTEFPPTQLNCELTSAPGGAQRFIYDGTYFNKDFYATHYENTVCCIIISVFRGATSATAKAYNAIFPVVLPRQALASTDPSTLSSDAFLKLQKSICYGLNLLFSKPGFIVVSTAQGYQYASLGINDVNFPILQTAQLPPLLWDVTPQTHQLCLRVNPSYVDPSGFFTIAFKVCAMENAFQNRQNINTGYVQLAGPERGWYADGAYLFGFGQFNPNTKLFEDPLTSAQQVYLNGLTLGTAYSISLSDWGALCASLGLFTTICCGQRSFSCIPTRYYKLKSSALSRLQKRPVNTNVQGGDFSAVIGLLYNPPDSANVYQDFGTSAPTIFFNGKMNGTNIIDLELNDEWGNLLYPYDKNINGQLMNYYENTDEVPTYPPAAYHPLDPWFATNGPNHDCLFPYYKINQTFLRYAASNSNGYKLPARNIYANHPSSSISHFIRVIGS
jgi:hypothetical protein